MGLKDRISKELGAPIYGHPSRRNEEMVRRLKKAMLDLCEQLEQLKTKS